MRDTWPTTLMLLRLLRHPVQRLLRLCLFLAGWAALLLAALAFTRLPFDAHRWLGTAAGACEGADAIVVLGGSGMPSGPELLRLHRAAEAAVHRPESRIILIHPGESAVIGAMADELVLRGVCSERITLINEGDNTRAQALTLMKHAPGLGHVALVTAPENMLRSVLAFRKAGFRSACGIPAWDHAMFHGFDYDHVALGGKPWMPDVSARPTMRYTFWNYLKLEVTCLREFLAMAYYQLNGWI